MKKSYFGSYVVGPLFRLPPISGAKEEGGKKATQKMSKFYVFLGKFMTFQISAHKCFTYKHVIMIIIT